MTYQEIAKICRAFGDENRVKIVELLTGGELCACQILEQFHITQPTLSHHMKTLADCQLINIRKDGRWMHYSLNCQTLSAYREFIGGLVCDCSHSSKGGCECK